MSAAYCLPSHALFHRLQAIGATIFCHHFVTIQRGSSPMKQPYDDHGSAADTFLREQA
jgi:hypothetical protein